MAVYVRGTVVKARSHAYMRANKLLLPAVVLIVAAIIITVAPLPKRIWPFRAYGRRPYIPVSIGAV